MRRFLANGNEAIADALLDQSVLAGVGNVFKSEICFVTGVHPFCTVSRSRGSGASHHRRIAKTGARQCS